MTDQSVFTCTKCGYRVCILVVALVVASVVTALLLRSHHVSPKSEVESFMDAVVSALGSSNPSDIMDCVILPASARGLTKPEQNQLLSKTLEGELTPEGIKRILLEGKRGMLLEIFPDQGADWASNAGVAPGNCLAYCLGDAALVIATNHNPWRLVRVDNLR